MSDYIKLYSESIKHLSLDSCLADFNLIDIRPTELGIVYMEVELPREYFESIECQEGGSRYKAIVNQELRSSLVGIKFCYNWYNKDALKGYIGDIGVQGNYSRIFEGMSLVDIFQISDGDIQGYIDLYYREFSKLGSDLYYLKHKPITSTFCLSWESLEGCECVLSSAITSIDSANCSVRYIGKDNLEKEVNLNNRGITSIDIVSPLAVAVECNYHAVFSIIQKLIKDLCDCLCLKIDGNKNKLIVNDAISSSDSIFIQFGSEYRIMRLSCSGGVDVTLFEGSISYEYSGENIEFFEDPLNMVDCNNVYFILDHLRELFIIPKDRIMLSQNTFVEYNYPLGVNLRYDNDNFNTPESLSYDRGRLLRYNSHTSYAVVDKLCYVEESVSDTSDCQSIMRNQENKIKYLEGVLGDLECVLKDIIKENNLSIDIFRQGPRSNF